MPSLLQQLENNEAVLLMYLADELDGADRAEVAQLLATDSQMRGQLEQLQRMDLDCRDALAAGDQRGILPESAALRQVRRLIRQWTVDRLSAQPAPMASPDRGRNWGWYIAATAALMVVGMVGWWGLKPGGLDGSGGLGPIAYHPPVFYPDELTVDEAPAGEWASGIDPWQAELLEHSWDVSMATMLDSAGEQRLDQALQLATAERSGTELDPWTEYSLSVSR